MHGFPLRKSLDKVHPQKTAAISDVPIPDNCPDFLSTDILDVTADSFRIGEIELVSGAMNRVDFHGSHDIKSCTLEPETHSPLLPQINLFQLVLTSVLFKFSVVEGLFFFHYRIGIPFRPFFQKINQFAGKGFQIFRFTLPGN